MTDAGSSGTEWVPRFGMLEVSPERAALIRGLFELAAFVADHPELPVPGVQASFYTGTGGWQAKCGVVDKVAAELGESVVEDRERGFYSVDAQFGPVRIASTAFTVEHMAAYNAHMASYRSSSSERVALDERLGDADAADTAAGYGGGQG